MMEGGLATWVTRAGMEPSIRIDVLGPEPSKRFRDDKCYSNGIELLQVGKIAGCVMALVVGCLSCWFAVVSNSSF